MPAMLLQTPLFVHSTLAGVALAVGTIPFLIHLINRRRYVRMRWAAMAFLLAAKRRSLKRLRLEQILLMLARIAIVVLFGLALARPYFSQATFVPLSSKRVLHVVVLDNSLSMNARSPDGTSRFERAKNYASALVDAFPDSDSVSLVTCSHPAKSAFVQPSSDRRFVREQLAAIVPTQRATDFVDGFSIAARIFDESSFPPANRAVYVISDFPRGDWDGGETQQPTPTVSALRRLAETVADPSKDVTLIPIALDERENVSVTGIAAESSLNAVNHPARFTVEVTNFGRSAQRQLILQVLRQGEVIRHEPIPTLEPGETTAVTVATLFPTPGVHLLQATISGFEQDTLVEDNTRYLSVEVRDEIPVLLVDGRSGVTRLAGQAGFLATAMAPRLSDKEASVIVPLVVSQPELTSATLSDYRMVALCNVERLTPETWAQLESTVSTGTGLLIFLGDLVQIDHYNEFGYRNGTGLLPGLLSPARRPETETGSELGIAYGDFMHPIVRVFEGHPESGLFTARVSAYLPMKLAENRGDVVLRYDNGEPAVVASRYGEGQVVVVTTTANMDWTNLPAKGDFVSLVSNFSSYLVRPMGTHRNLVVGQSVRERLTAAESSMPLGVSTPADRRTDLREDEPSSFGRQEANRGSSNERRHAADTDVPVLVPDDEALALSYGPIERAGVVRVSIGSDERLFAVNVDTAESDLTTLDADALSGGLGVPVHVVAHYESEVNALELSTARSADLAPMLLYVVLALLFVEMWMAMKFGAQRTNRTPIAEKGSDTK